MKIAVWTVTRGASKAALKIKEKIESVDIYTLKKFELENSFVMDNFGDVLKEKFNIYDAHIFIMATGIVVRKISSLIKSKDVDPAVLVVDENMNFVISLLSGHLGGANDLAQVLNSKLGLVSIITTSSDVTGKIAVDTLAQKLKCNLASLEEAKNVTALIVDGKNVELKLPKNIVGDNPEGIIIVSNKDKVETVQLYPKNLIVGIGSRRGVSSENIIRFLKEVL
ncbi:MAG: cobalt-precorrin 5A hydrolase, partial [Cetobacterium sp.]